MAPPYPTPTPGPAPTPTNPPSLGGYDPGAAAASTSLSGASDIYGLGDLAKQEIVLRSAYVHRPRVGQNQSAAWQRAFAQANDQPTQDQTLAEPGTVQDSYIWFIRMSQDPAQKQQFYEWQQKLYAAGFYGSAKPTDVAWGTWDLATGAALKSAFSAAVQVAASGAPVTFDEYLTGLGQAKTAAQSGIGTGPLVVQHEDPKAVAGMLQQAAQASLGRDLSDAEVEHFISEYKAAEDAYYKGRKVATDATGGRVDVTQPNLQAQAESFVQGGHGTEAAGNNMADYVKALESMLGGG